MGERPDGRAWRRVRTRLGRLRDQRAYAALLRRPRPVGYIGWAGRGNVGDDALLLAHQVALPQMAFAPLPNVGPSATYRVLARFTGGRPLQAVCLGGGTLIGNGHFRATLETVLAVQPDIDRFVLGAGVESEEFRAGNRRDVEEELRRWVPHLASFEPVRVRGPRSAATLADLGVDAEVVGDPALLLGDDGPTGLTRPGLLGLNVGMADDQWGDADSVLERVADLGRVHRSRGGAVRVVAASSADADYSKELAARIGSDTELVLDALDPDGFLDALRPCEVVVAEKLHAVVLAAAVHVPAVALEYRPKCRDFQESVGRGGYVVRTDELATERLVGLVDEIVSARDRQVRELGAAIEDLRRRLRSAAAEILLGWPPTSGS